MTRRRADPDSAASFSAIGSRIHARRIQSRSLHASVLRVEATFAWGEWYYSVVVEDGEDFKRREYSAEGWSEPPENAVGWWKSRMPVDDDKKLVLAPPAVLVDLLRQMDQIPQREQSRFLLALMLMRRRVVKAAEPAQEQRDEVEYLRVEVATTGEVIEIPIPKITRGEADSLKDELNQLLYCEAAEEDAEDEFGEDTNSTDHQSKPPAGVSQ